MIVIFWHGGMLVPWFAHRGSRCAALVSGSGDGEVLAAILHHWGIRVVRGSSSKGGSEAIQEMVRLVEEGFSVLITPDGPRGPAEYLKIGALVVAQRTGAPLLLCAPRYRRAWQLKSWDGFRLPKPYSRVDMKWNGPIVIPPECVHEALEVKRMEIERLLHSMHA